VMPIAHSIQISYCAKVGNGTYRPPVGLGQAKSNVEAFPLPLLNTLCRNAVADDQTSPPCQPEFPRGLCRT
jgi:hypothetical protein